MRSGNEQMAQQKEAQYGQSQNQRGGGDEADDGVDAIRAKIFGEAEKLPTGPADLLLRTVGDWTTFEESVVTSDSMALAADLIQDSLDAEDWNNIPLPLVHALDVIKTSLLSTESLLLFLCRESRSKCENVVKTFKHYEGKAKDKENALRTKIETNTQSLEKQAKQIGKSAEEQIKEVRSKVQVLGEAVREDRRLFSERLEKYAEKEETADWVMAYVAEKVEPLEYKLNKHLLDFEARHQQIMEENLLVPGLIGRADENGHMKCPNLKTYLECTAKEVNDRFAEQRQSLEEQSSAELEKKSKALTENVEELRKRTDEGLEQCHDKLQSLCARVDGAVSHLGTDLTARLDALEQQLQHVEAHLGEDKEKNENTLLPRAEFEAWTAGHERATGEESKSMDRNLERLGGLSAKLEAKVHDLMGQCERRCKADAQRQIAL